MFITRKFSAGDVTRGLIDPWLESLNDREHGMMVIGYTSYDGMLIITVKQWRRSEVPSNAIPVRDTIDELPEEPTIEQD